MKIRAPAKINLRLRVVGKRVDGYHLVDTILVPVSLYDEINIDKGRQIGKTTPRNYLTLTCDDPLVPQGKNNLAYKAASILLDDKRIDHSVHIHIRKRIPVGAGLGGGSTDAAATLVGLNRLFRLGYTSAQLEKLSLALGADVPFFIRGVPARARGIGERLTPLHGVPRLWLIILYPNLPVATAWVYNNLHAKLTKAIVNTSINFALGSPARFRKLLVNDLETVTMGRYPRIGLLKEELVQQGAVGSSYVRERLFSVWRFPSRRNAEQAFRRLRNEKGVQAFLVRALN